MIPRYQKVIFFALAGSITLMAMFLFYERERVRDRLTVRGDRMPLAPQLVAVTSAVTLDMANDRNGSVTAIQRQIAVPLDSSARAQALLDRLLSEYALPGSNHALPAGAAINDVFLLKRPLSADLSADAQVETVVINLRGEFLMQHPSGVQTEMLTLLSMLGTLHANLPEIHEARFVVDGRTRSTLAGHVDLDRAYPVIDTTVDVDSLQPAP